MKTTLRGMALTFVAIMGVFVLVGRAQNVGSGQVPVEPPSPPRDHEIARRTLGRIQKLSAAFGTTVAIENNVGVIRARASSTWQP